MLNLIKIYIENFKGVLGPSVLDLEESDLAIFNGPNGFGKTTVFDVIELCIRGKMERTVQFGNIQKNTQNYSKPFYQNTSGKDVVLKLLFKESETGAVHVIIKFLDHRHDGKIGNSKKFRPDAWAILQTFYSDSEGDFDAKLDITKVSEIQQKDVDAIFLLPGGLSQENLFPLFHYLQQEENIYFLKKDEEEKKTELNFLFQTQLQAEELAKQNQLLKQLRTVKENINERLTVLGTSVKGVQPANHIRLFQSKELPYDQADPFNGIPSAQLPAVMEGLEKELSRLREFAANFDTVEYEKQKRRDALLNAVQNQNILASLIMQNLMEEARFNKIQELSTRRASYTHYVARFPNNDSEFNAKILEELGFDKAMITAFDGHLKDKKELEEKVGTLGKMITELNSQRETVRSSTENIPADMHPPNCCPLCGHEFKSKDHFLEHYVRKTEMLTVLNDISFQALRNSELFLNNAYRNPAIEAIKKFLESDQNQLDEVFYQRLMENRGYAEAIKRFMAILSQGNINVEQFILTETVSFEILQDKIEALKQALSVEASVILPDQLKLQHKELYKELFSENKEELITIEEVENKILYVKYKFDEARLYSLNVLRERVEKIELAEKKINEIKSVLQESIKKFKLEMIDKIKIPFYLYSGKILQNYQQGLGIFIDMQENTNRIRFLTDNKSEHDIIHHLSSGQLAVVSIAFCLAMNKVYSTSKNFKFLAIDDPVQTLDDINIHSFIELMRHDFREYQLIMSTHEDEIASYLSYKFGKFGFTTNSINMQKEFYG